MGLGNNDNTGNTNVNNLNNNQQTSEVCDNQLDDDGDGYVDCDDSDCDFDVACEAVEVCTNGVDDDGDGDVDCADLDCVTAQGCQPEDCGNGVDDNANGQVDCVRKEHIGASVKAKREMRREMSKPGAIKQTEVKGGGFRLIASLDQGAADVMTEQCGGDPDKVRAFLRDHPEHLVVPRSSTKIRGRRKVFYPGMRRS